MSLFVGNKARGRILKRVFQENKARQIFRKKNISNPPDAHMYVCISFVFLKHPFLDSPFCVIIDVFM